MPTKKLVVSLTDLAVKIDQTHELSPAPSELSTSSFVSGKRKYSSQVQDDMDKDKRRKLMNRVAAQQSRDRKRQHIEQLELELRQLKAENETLKIKNQMIQQEKERLKVENQQIKYETESLKQQKTLVEEAIVPVTFESAALISGPLPQGQVSQAYLLQTFVLLMLQMLQFKQDNQFLTPTPVSSTTFSPSSKSCVKNWSTEELNQIRQLITRFVSKVHRMKHQSNHGPLRYQQESWNPSKNFYASQISLTPLS